MRAPYGTAGTLRAGLRVRVRSPTAQAGGVSLNCEYFGTCPGCDISENLQSPPLLADAQRFFSERGVRLQTRWGSPRGYRTTAKLAVRREPGGDRVVVGLFQRGSHNVVPLSNCVVQHPSINEAVELIQHTLRNSGVVCAYDEASGSGLLRYVQASVQRDTGRVQLTLVANARSPADEAALPEFAKLLWAAGGGERMWHSIWLNINTTPNNVIFSHEPGAWQAVLGEQVRIDRYRDTSRSGSRHILDIYLGREREEGQIGLCLYKCI